MLRQQYDLADVLRNVRERSMHGRQGSERLGAYMDGDQEIGWARVRQRIGERGPSGVPDAHDRGPTLCLADDELSIPVAVRLLSIGAEKVRPPGLQVSSDVLDDDRDAVRLGIHRAEEITVVHLGERALCKLLLATECEQRVL